MLKQWVKVALADVENYFSLPLTYYIYSMLTKISTAKCINRTGGTRSPIRNRPRAPVDCSGTDSYLGYSSGGMALGGLDAWGVLVDRSSVDLVPSTGPRRGSKTNGQSVEPGRVWSDRENQVSVDKNSLQCYSGRSMVGLHGEQFVSD